MTDARLTRLGVEVLALNDDPEARLTRIGSEVLALNDDPEARLTRIGTEILLLETVPDALHRIYVGTSTVGASALAMTTSKTYIKQVYIPAGYLLASVEAHLDTVNDSSITLRPALYEDNSGVAGKLIGYIATSNESSLQFNGRNDWVSLPLGKFYEVDAYAWIGIFAPGIGTGVSLSHATDVGEDRQVNGFAAGYVGEVGDIAAATTITDPGTHLYSIRASLIGGWNSYQKLGRETVGGSWLTMTNAVYLKKITVPGGSFISSIATHIRHNIANGSALRAVIYEDSGGSPGPILWPTPSGLGMFLSTTGRWLHFPVGKWVPTTTDYWIGVQMTGNTSFQIAYDASGGSDGDKSTHHDTGTWTAGDDNYSIFAEVLS